MTRAELIAALEKATGPDRALDGEIHVCVVQGIPREEYLGAMRGDFALDVAASDEFAPGAVPAYTDSIDAAMTLVGDGYEWLRKSPGVMTVYRVPPGDKDWARHHDATGATPALALCIATLRAREAT